MVQYGNVTVDQLTDGLDQLLIANRTSYATVQKVSTLEKNVKKKKKTIHTNRTNFKPRVEIPL